MDGPADRVLVVAHTRAKRHTQTTSSPPFTQTQRLPREGGDGNLFAVAVGPHFGIFDGWAAASTEGYSGPVYKKLVVKQRSTKVDGISTFRTRAEAREAGLVYLESEAARRGLEAEQAAVGAAGTRG